MKEINIERFPIYFGVEYFDHKRYYSTTNFRWLLYLSLQVTTILSMVIVGVISLPFIFLWNTCHWLIEDRIPYNFSPSVKEEKR